MIESMYVCDGFGLDFCIIFIMVIKINVLVEFVVYCLFYC